MRSPLKACTRACVAQLLDWVYPRYCLGCSKLCPGASNYRYLCERCSWDMAAIEPPYCFQCAYPFHGVVEAPKACPRCTRQKFYFERARSLFLLDGPVKMLVHELKYHNGRYVLPDIQKAVEEVRSLGDYLRGSVLVPVPLHSKKERRRGFNQSQLLAEALATVVESVQGVEQLLERIRYTASQTRLDIQQRHRNVNNAFALSDKVAINRRQTYTLVDDVFTTGSTLNACAKTLRQAGAASVQVLTLCHG